MGFSGIALFLVAISMMVSGPGVLAAYPRMFLNGEYRALMGFQPEYAANIRGLVYLITRGKNPAIFGAVVAALSALLLWITAKNWKDNEFELCFSVAVIASLLTGYHAFIYDLSLLLLPVAIVCGELAKRKMLFSSLTFNSTLIVLFVQPIHYELADYHVYALMCVPVLVLFVSVLRMASRGGRLSEIRGTPSLSEP